MSGRVGSITTDIIADGLVFNVDAANRASYPAQRTLATAESGSCYNTLDLSISGSFISDPQFITQPVSASCWQFDGVDDSIDTVVPTQPLYHLSVWFTRTGGITSSLDPDGTITLLGYGESGTLTGIWFGGFSSLPDDETITLYQNVQELDYLTYIRDTGDSNFHNLTINWNGTQYDMYLDGTSRTTYTGSIGHLAQFDINHIYLGRSNNSEYHHTGKISSIQLYNKSLSTQEVLHNYNALKGRFS